MTIPLSVLALGSILAGWIGVPKLWSFMPEGFRLFEHWLEPVFTPIASLHVEEHHADHATEWLLMGLSVAIAIAGILIARYVYLRPWKVDPIENIPLHKTLLNKWYVDEIYDFLFVNGLAKGGGRASARFDQRVVDGGVNGAGWLTRLSSSLSIWWDTWIIDGAVRLGSFLVRMLSYPVRIVQTGFVQAYALIFVAGVAIFFGYYLMR